MPTTRRSLNYDFARDGAPGGQNFLDPLFTFTRPTHGARTNASGLIEEVAAGVPRYDFDPVTLQCRGLLIEGQRTNLVPRSSEFGTGWTLNDNSQTPASGTSPLGTNTATKITPNTSNATHRLLRSLTGVTNGARHTISIYAKADGYNWIVLVEGNAVTATAFFDVSTGAVGNVTGTGSPTAKITPAGNGWYRCEMSYVTGSTTPNVQYWISNGNGVSTFAGNGTSGVLVWHAQYELGAMASSAIFTGASAVTRAADRIYTDALSPWASRLRGTIFAEWSHIAAADDYRVVFELGDGSGNRLDCYTHPSAPQLRTNVVSASADQANWQDSPPLTAGAVNRIAVSYEQARFARALNGAAIGVIASGNVPASLSRLSLGCNRSGGEQLYGHLSRFAYAPLVVDDITLRQMTVAP